MNKKEQILNGFSEMMKGLWGNQDLKMPSDDVIRQEPCEDAISRKELLNSFWWTYCQQGDFGYHQAKDLIKSVPPVTPTHKKGKWIIDDEENGRIWNCYCSKCKKDILDYIGGSENWWLVHLPNYCPNCGEEMEGAEIEVEE